MAHFYLHLRDGDHLIPDEEGVELPNLFAARPSAAAAGRADFSGSTLAGLRLRFLEKLE
jgi:hypothetical protein